MNNVKVFLDFDFLTIPHVFSQTGWLGGIMLYCLIAALNLFTMTQVLAVAKTYSERKDKAGETRVITSYTELAERIHGKLGKYAVIVFLFIAQFSCCVGYLFFVALVLDRIVCDQTGYCNSATQYKWLTLVATIPLCLLKTYTYISYVSISGIACGALGAIMLIGYCGNVLASGEAVVGSLKVFDIGQFFGYVGIAMFAFEGNGTVINLRAEARDPEGYPRILRSAVLTIIVCYMVLSTIAYWTYKSETGNNDYIVENLPLSAFTIVINALFCVTAITSYPLQILCTFQVIENVPFFNNNKDTPLAKNLKMYTERVLIVLIVTIVAILIPSLVDFLNIAGSLGVAALGFILPQVYYIASKNGTGELSKIELYFNLFLIAFGVFGAAFSLYNSISNLLNGE